MFGLHDEVEVRDVVSAFLTISSKGTLKTSIASVFAVSNSTASVLATDDPHLRPPVFPDERMHSATGANCREVFANYGMSDQKIGFIKVGRASRSTLVLGGFADLMHSPSPS